MDPREAVLEVLRGAGEPLHWTVVLDRALRGGLIDPFVTTDVRGTVQRTLRGLAEEGVVVKPAKGVYALAPTYGR